MKTQLLREGYVVARCGPWRSFDAVEFTLTCVGGFNNRRLLDHIGNILPAEA